MEFICVISEPAVLYFVKGGSDLPETVFETSVLTINVIFENVLLPIINIVWVDETLHRMGISAILTAGQKELSLVDCISFAGMRKLGIRHVFAFNKRFAEKICDSTGIK